MTDFPEVISLTPKEAVAQGAESFTTFAKLFFPKTFRQSFADYHRIIGDDLYSASRFNSFIMYRDAAKTTFLRGFTAQRISYGISRTIMYVGASQPHAIMSLRWIKKQVLHNTAWANTFGLVPGQKWTDEWMEIDNQIEGTTVTLLAMGVTGNVRGFNPDDYRPDLIILDDILTDENTKTKEQRTKINDLVFGALLNSLAPATEAPLAKAAILGQIFHREDVLSRCKMDPDWHTRTFSCFNDDGESSWPARYPTQTLLKEKAVRTAMGLYSTWMREKECKLVAKEGKCFDISKLNYWTELPSKLMKVGAIDPASSKEDAADNHAVGAVGANGFDIFLLQYYLEKAVMPDAAANQVFNIYLNFPGIIRFCVEAISYQRTLAWYLRQEMTKRRIFFAIEEVQDRRNKNDRIIQALAGPLAMGHLWCHPSHSAFIQQLDDFDPSSEDNDDDLLDMVAMALMSMNLTNRAIEGEFSVVDDEEEYEELTYGDCP